MINRLRFDRKSGWRIEYSWCDERGGNWPSVYLKTTPKEFLKHVKMIEKRMRDEAKMLARLATHLMKDMDSEVRYYPCCPECHKVLGKGMTAEERAQHVLDCMAKRNMTRCPVCGGRVKVVAGFIQHHSHVDAPAGETCSGSGRLVVK
jgi:hypothetical protein